MAEVLLVYTIAKSLLFKDIWWCKQIQMLFKKQLYLFAHKFVFMHNMAT
jgi:hypothetical protein